MKITKHEMILSLSTLAFILFSFLSYPYFQSTPNVCVPASEAAVPYLVNINTATADELDDLDGIGANLAEQIIEYRKENGKFKNTDELCNVSGIGKAKFEQLKGYIKV